MTLRRTLAASLFAATLALGVTAASADGTHRPPPGSNEVLVVPLANAEGLEVFVSDVVLPPGFQVPPHSHPGQEIVYVIEGSAVHVEEGAEDRIYKAGEAFTIQPGVVHSPYAGDEGARAIVFRVHVEGQPIRIPAE